MTGNLKYFEDKKDDPKHDRMLVTFSSGHLAYDCQRMLGKISLAKKPEDFVEKKGLGPDALEVGFEGFKQALNGRSAKAKSLLLNQSVIAGIGNIYGDEILFQSGVHPEKHVDELSEGKIKEIYNNMRRILKTAIRNRADPKKFPEGYIISQRKKGGKCPKGDSKLKTVKISGRTSYYCPNHQKK
jgi:formamidopyrimidine-DNA glycosylase